MQRPQPHPHLHIAPADWWTSFLVMVRSAEEQQRARVLIESLRTFGGPLSGCPVWVLVPDTADVLPTLQDLGEVILFPFEVAANLQATYFSAKVSACAVAESEAPRGVRSLVWLDPCTLILQPPYQLDLTGAVAAFRPVHIRNVGSLASEPLDPYWTGIYRAVGLEAVRQEVESFVDGQRLRPYYNTHVFAWDPSSGLATRWLDSFRALATDRSFRDGPCQDELHHIFLHQAVLSALVTRHLAPEQVRLLPPDYNYPLHLHQRVPPERRTLSLGRLVTPVYEEHFPSPDTLGDIQIEEPLSAWLASRHS